ncbi:helix-turn-helix domain-containing protein [Burkholderia lata]|uniref:helix-turn-helix domain-containing protein n=1 Tax=Burkholderia lata (strain ATCC 17760 / DSM 23089 / LMG 22485 / NCIMB 9086 / R18194 / 383) TaxID=482957 RepID=UPI0015826EB6|nr:helix-turn-helix domain-containing protein [Burkholderia lata]
MSLVWERYPEGGGELILALALADYAHDNGAHIFPAVDTLARKTRQSRRNVQYQLRRMEEKGWLQLVAYAAGGRSRGREEGRPREYRINPEWVKGAEIAPFQKSAADDTEGRNSRHERVQKATPKGAAAVAPEPSVNRHEPSGNQFIDRDAVDGGAFSGRLASFERWWQTWPRSPRKVAKAVCEKRWAQQGLDAHAEVIIAHTAAMKLSAQWKAGYDPAPATYLNQERWRDELPPDESELAAGGAGDAGQWWESASGTEAQGRRVGVEPKPNEPTPDYLVRVARASGRGPWIDHVLKVNQKGNPERFQQIVRFLGDDLLPVDWCAA